MAPLRIASPIPVQQRASLLIALLSLLLCAGYCGEADFEVMEVRNGTDETVLLFYVDDEGREVRIGSIGLRPGRLAPFDLVIDGEEAECTPGAVIARNEDGVEITRRRDPLCRGHLWVIEDQSSA